MRWMPFVVALVACGVEEAPVDPVAVGAAESTWIEEALAEEGVDATPEDLAALPGRLTVWQSCGDPVCSGWRPKGLPGCGNVQPGDRCPQILDGRQCDPGDGCNTILQCAANDPWAGPCPISKRSAKEDVAYVDAEQRRRLADELLRVRLATYTYKADPAATPRLGFLIDDVAPSPAVLPTGERVDLYAYTSMAVATIQQQQAELDALRAEVEALKAEVARR